MALAGTASLTVGAGAVSVNISAIGALARNEIASDTTAVIRDSDTPVGNHGIVSVRALDQSTILVDTVATTTATTFISLGNSVLEARSGPCSLVTGRFLSPTVQVSISDARTLMGLRAVSGLGATGTPALVAGSDAPRNPKGNWAPLNSGDYSGGIVSLLPTSRPVSRQRMSAVYCSVRSPSPSGNGSNGIHRGGPQTDAVTQPSLHAS